MKRAFIIHGWGGNSKEGWFPWLKKELESKGYEATVFDMPDTETPTIEKWVRYLEENIQNPDEETILIGHSIGCQTVLRYLEKLPEDVKVKKIILVAPWYYLANLEKEEILIADPWLKTPIDEREVLNHVKDEIICIFSDNDFYNCLEENKKIFKDRYNAEIIVEHSKGHFSVDDGITELPEVVESVEKLAR